MASAEDLALGKASISLGLLKPAQLASCMKLLEQRRQSGLGCSLSDIFLEQGYIDKPQLSSLLQSVRQGGQTAAGEHDSRAETRSRVGQTPVSEHDSRAETKDRKSFGRYQLLQELGRGGMGCVYKAHDTELGRTVALKMLLSQQDEALSQLSSDGARRTETGVVRFLQEAKAMAALRHPNIVSVYDVGTHAGRHYFTMDFIAGESLKSVAARSPLSVRDTVGIMVQVCDAIHYAHTQGIIHRDIKPANIMLTSDRTPKVMDFGLAKVNRESNKLSQSGMIIGTLQYMPPEQADGKVREIDERSDVYSLGATLYEMLTGRPPFIGESFGEMIAQIFYQEPPPLRQLKPNIPHDVETICLKALEKSKQKRYQSAKELGDDLARFYRGEAVAVRAPRVSERMWRLAKKHKATSIALLSGAMCMLLAATASWLFGRWQRTERWRTMEREAERLSQDLATTDAILARHRLAGDDAWLPPEARLEIDSALLRRMQVRALFEQALVLFPDNAEIRRRLYDSEKQIGLLALAGQNYVLSQLCFERCHTLAPQADAQSLLSLLREKREQVKKKHLRRVAAIMDELAKGPPEEGMSDEYVSELLRMQGEHTVVALLGFLDSASEWQRRIAIEALGKGGDKRSRWQDKDVVEWLLARLESLDLQRQTQEAEDLVWALGRLRDGRAHDLVTKVRQQFGYRSYFFSKTRIPYRWLPQPDGTPSQDNYAEYYNRACICKDKGDIDGAIANYNESLRRRSDYAHSYLGRGTAWMDKGELARAIADYDEAIRLSPDCVEAYLNRGLAKSRNKDTTGAIADYDEAIRRRPNYADAYINRGVLRFNLKDTEGALSDYDEAIRINPDATEAYINRSIVRRNKGDRAGSIADCGEALRLNPRLAVVYNNRGATRDEDGDSEGAISDYSEAIRINPQYALAYFNRGVVLANKNDLDAAFADHDRAIRINPQLAEAYRSRAMLWHRKGDKAKAAADFQKYVDLCPNASDVPTRLDYIRKHGKKE